MATAGENDDGGVVATQVGGGGNDDGGVVATQVGDGGNDGEAPSLRTST